MDLQTAILGLNHNSTEKEQKQAIEYLKKLGTDDLKKVFAAIGKPEWKAFVSVVSAVGFPDNMPLFPLLLELLQDMNWPGAWEAVDLMASVGSTQILPLVEDAIFEAYQKKDYIWLSGLAMLNDKLASEGVSVSKEAYALLKYADY